MKADFHSLVTLLATQCMINLGEIPDPLGKQTNSNRPGAALFIDLLAVLQKKSQGNLDEREEKFLLDVIDNLKAIYTK